MFFCAQKGAPSIKSGARNILYVMKHILFTGGGSAGHVVPNLALMNEIRYSHRVSYMGTGGMEEALVTQAGYPFFRVDTPKLVRAFTPKNLLIPHRLRLAKRMAKEILQRERPDLVFSKGGYASYPAVWAAHKLRIPVFTHESDLSPGLCTRLIAKKCRMVLTCFAETASLFANGKYVGAPVRREVLNGDRERARRKYGFAGNKPVLLVLGGGSGSRALNEGVRAALPQLLARYDILHLCGAGNVCSDAPAGYVQREFERDMGSAYACCDLALSRAGSNAAFELLLTRTPALLVPLARASRGDQVENAHYFLMHGWAHVLAERELAALPAALKELEEDEEVKRALAACPVTPANARILALFSAIPAAEA